MTKRLTVFSVAAFWLACAVAAIWPRDRVEAQSIPGISFTCSADNIGASLTLLTGCTQAPENYRRFITDVVAQSTTATGGQFILRQGTAVASGGSANCATSTTSVLPSAATAARLSAAANTGPPTVIDLTTPVIVPANKDLCVLGVGTNTTSIQITGYLAP